MSDLRLARVASTSPPHVRLDGYPSPVPIDVSLESALVVGARVLVAVRPVPGSWRSEVYLIGIVGGSVPAIPAGVVWEFDGLPSKVPAGWLVCDGSAVSRTTYAALFDAIGTLHGAGNGSTTFNLPDRRGRTGVGKATTGQFGTVGSKPGEESHTLTLEETPPHSHQFHGDDGTAGYGYAKRWDHGSGGWAASGQSANYLTSHVHNAAGDSVTSSMGQAHNNVQPSFVSIFIIKT